MGYSDDPSYVVQNQIYTGYAGASANRDPAGILGTTDFTAFLVTLGATNPAALSNFFLQYDDNSPMASNIDTFVADLCSSVNATGPGTPLTIGTDDVAIKQYLLNTIGAALMLDNPNPDGTVMNPIASAVFTDIYEQAFTKFIKGFQYTGTTVWSLNVINHTTGTAVDEAYFSDRFNEFFFQMATVTNATPVPAVIDASGAPLINFQDIFTAYLGNNPTAFETFLANYINELLDLPTPPGSGQSFIPSQDVGEWLNKVQQAYTISLKGSGAPLISSVGQTTRKVDVLLRIYALLVELIETLQKVAAAQSDRLQLLSAWAGAYTNLQIQVPLFTAGDGTIFGGTYGNNGNTTNVATQSRDDANSLNQTYTETIRSRRTQVDNSAKSLQNNLNQSNDTANQQSDAATTILQNLRSILSALYR